MKIHGDIYDYSLVDYKNTNTKVKIICKIHGEFEQKPNYHIQGNGCPKCGGGVKLTTEEFIEKAQNKHGFRYEYHLVDYKNTNTKVKILCPDHGIFNQKPNYHIQGNGCPKCTSSGYSKIANEWLLSLRIPNLQTVLSPEGEFKIPGSYYRADGYCKDTNTVYEFHGDYWHGNPKKHKPYQINKKAHKTFGELYENTLRKKEYICSLGFSYVEMWESDFSYGLGSEST